MTSGSALSDVLERLRAASVARDAGRLAALYAEDAVHEFPFTTPGGPTRIEGRAAISEFLAAVYRSLPLQYSEYRTIAVHQVSEATLVVEQEALGVNTRTGRAAKKSLKSVFGPRTKVAIRVADSPEILAACSRAIAGNPRADHPHQS